MTIEDVKAVIIRRINEMQGCKASFIGIDHEVIATILKFEGETKREINLPDLLAEMVKERLIMEIEYVLIGTIRIKSFYLPAKTETKIVGVEEIA